MEEKNPCTANKKCIDCLLVNKVYDACSKRECIEGLVFDLCGICSNEYTFLYPEYGTAEIERYDCEPFFTEIDSTHAKLKAVVVIPVFAVLKRKSDKKIIRVPAKPVFKGTVQSDNKVRIPMECIFCLPSKFLRQGRFTPYAESYVETGCAVDYEGDRITLTLGIFLIIKAISAVQLQIPSYGFCPTPPECEDEACDINFCEDFLDEGITPFPCIFPNNICNC